MGATLVVTLLVCSMASYVALELVLYYRKKKREYIESPDYQNALKETFAFFEYFKDLGKNEYVSHDITETLQNKYKSAISFWSTAKYIPQEIPFIVDNYNALCGKIKEKNEQFIKNEKKRLADFFSTCMGDYALDNQQTEACIADELADLVVAGAGSGKTSTIVGKVLYLLTQRNIDPKNILLIAFTNKAVTEMSTRLNEKLPNKNIPVFTFHALANRKILPLIQEHRSIADETVLEKIVEDYLFEVGNDKTEAARLINFFAYHFYADEPELKKSKTYGEYIDKTWNMNFETLKGMINTIPLKGSILPKTKKHITFSGEKVRSNQEVLIANFLFLNGIKYEYEKEYPRDLLPKHWSSYKPDFYLPEYDIYLEHFGVDKHGNPPSYFEEIEKEKYVISMRNKRELHKENGTKLIESYSYWDTGEHFLEKLLKLLQDNGITPRPMTDDDCAVLWKKIIEEGQKKRLQEFQKLICAFIGLFKANNYPEYFFDELMRAPSDTNSNKVRQEIFLQIVRPIYHVYQKYLKENNKIDFNDMINMATDYVIDSSNELPLDMRYKYIIIDEFQDISIGRMKLVKALRDRNAAKIFCVGDDWQSIFRFSGSDLDIFTNFKKYFGYNLLLRIEKTYRNSQELIDTMGAFIMMNPKQIKKSLQSIKHCDNPIVPIFYNENELGKAVEHALELIGTQTLDKKASVFLLGRTKYDKECLEAIPSLKPRVTHPKQAEDVYQYDKNENLDISFLTVHKAKGMEADYVILLNVKNDTLGFPNRISDDPVLGMVLAGDTDRYLFAEERRLFYVALTRTKNNCYLLVPTTKYSQFFDELECKSDTMIYVDGSLPEDHHTCPACKTGILVPRKKTGEKNDKETFWGCSHFPICNFSVNISNFHNGRFRCDKCGSFLVEREGKFGKFLGCLNYPVCENTLNLDGTKSHHHKKHSTRTYRARRGYY